MDMDDVYRMRRRLASNRFLVPKPVAPCLDDATELEDDDVRTAPFPEGAPLRDLLPPDTGGEG